MDYENEIKNLKETVNILTRSLDEHIGGGGEKAHFPADAITPGFLYPETYSEINEAKGVRELVTGTDVLQLPAGKYYGYDLDNTPLEAERTSISLIDVTESGEGRKEIYFSYSALGKKFYRAQHTNGANVTYGYGKWMAVDMYVKNKQVSKTFSLGITGQANYDVLEFPHFKLVQVTIWASNIRGSASSGEWIKDFIPSNLRLPVNKQIRLVSATNANNTVDLTLTSAGVLQCWQGLPDAPAEWFRDTVMYMIFKDDLPDGWK